MEQNGKIPKQTNTDIDKDIKTIQWRNYSRFKKWCWNHWISTCKSINIDMYLTPCTKIHSKLITDLNAKHKTMKFLEDGIGKISAWLRVWQWVLGYNQSSTDRRKKLLNCTLSKLRTFAFWKTLLRNFLKNKPQNRRKYVYITCLWWWICT